MAQKKKSAASGKVKKIKTTKMSAAELKKYKMLLLKEREKAGGELSHITENTLNKSQRDASGDLSGYSYHMADMASDQYERDFLLRLASDERERLYAIDEALKRIEEKTYGNCQLCQKLISKKRLDAVPQTLIA